jgi:hypothetical protein
MFMTDALYYGSAPLTEPPQFGLSPNSLARFQHSLRVRLLARAEMSWVNSHGVKITLAACWPLYKQSSDRLQIENHRR